MQWKLHEVYEGDPSKDLVMVGTEPEPVILCNQARTQVDGVGHQPATEPPTHSLSCLHDVLGPKPTTFLIREITETSFCNQWERMQRPTDRCRQRSGSPAQEEKEEGEEEGRRRNCMSQRNLGHHKYIVHKIN